MATATSTAGPRFPVAAGDNARRLATPGNRKTSHDLEQAARALLGVAIALRGADQPIDARRVLLASLDVSYRHRCVVGLMLFDLPEGTAVDYARRLKENGEMGRQEFDQLVDLYDHRGPVDWESIEQLLDFARTAREANPWIVRSDGKEPDKMQSRRLTDNLPESVRFIRNNYDGTAVISVVGLFEAQIRPGNEPLAQLLDQWEAEEYAREYNSAMTESNSYAVAIPMDDPTEQFKGHHGRKGGQA